jgi:hypothetical protein
MKSPERWSYNFEGVVWVSRTDWIKNEDIYEGCGWQSTWRLDDHSSGEDEHGKRELTARKKAGIWD